MSASPKAASPKKTASPKKETNGDSAAKKQELADAEAEIENVAECCDNPGEFKDRVNLILKPADQLLDGAKHVTTQDMREMLKKVAVAHWGRHFFTWVEAQKRPATAMGGDATRARVDVAGRGAGGGRGAPVKPAATAGKGAPAVKPVATTAAATKTAAATTGSGLPAAGATVEIHSLKLHPHFNGLQRTVVGVRELDSAVIVDLPNMGPTPLRMKNIKVIKAA
eukprot:TRINITY_DN6230_c0_g1_i1.p2 TRINITY_DN6230_c0_g1~~TRINITY_DN6230_c0_g1_i1.p2  ORF type:complete len:253 (+),score=100.23 TRINITY_DN6230_c0_g1_i1:90-761(+)